MNYNVTTNNGTLIVGPATLGITASDTNRLYNTANPVFTYTASGFVNGDTAGVLNGAPSLTTIADAGSPVGSYPIVATNGTMSATNYVFSFTNGTLAVLGAGYAATWTNPASITYGTALGTNQNNATAGIPGGFDYNPTNGALLPAGTNVLNVTFTPDDTNYAATNLSVTLVVMPAPLSVTASNVSRVYGQPNPVFGGMIIGIQNGDDITATYAVSATTNSVVGNYPIVPMLSDPNSRLVNYAVTTNNGTLTVSKAVLAITADNTSRLYGAVNPAFTYSASGFVNGDNAGVLGGTPALTTTATTNSPVGDYSITATNGTLSATNYMFNFASGTLTVGKATLNVTANNTNRVYGATNPVFTASYGGFVNGENASVLTGSPGLTSVAASGSGTGTYPIVATNGTLSAANYAFSFVNGTLTVGQASLTVTANDQGKFYGATLTLGRGPDEFHQQRFGEW